MIAPLFVSFPIVPAFDTPAPPTRAGLVVANPTPAFPPAILALLERVAILPALTTPSPPALPSMSLPPSPPLIAP